MLKLISESKFEHRIILANIDQLNLSIKIEIRKKLVSQNLNGKICDAKLNWQN